MFRFTIRDVLWLMVVVGLAVGWWSDRAVNGSQRLWHSRAEELAKICRGYGWTVVWEGDHVNGAFPPQVPD
jgi:hypothetical protein